MAAPPDMTRRTLRYWFIDGLPELFMGGFLLLFIVLQLFIRLLPPPVAGFAQLLIPLLVIGFSFGARPLLQGLKVRTIYPHTGYVEYPQPTARQWAVGTILGVAIGFGLPAALVAWVFLAPSGSFSLPLFTGGIAALVLSYIGFCVGMRRFFVLAVVSVLLGAGVMLLPVDGHIGYLLVFAVLGLWLLVSGASTFQHYRRTYVRQE